MAVQEIGASGELDILQADEWTRISAPTPARPVWHSVDDGEELHFKTLIIGRSQEERQQIDAMHVNAIAVLLRSSFEAEAESDWLKQRTLIYAAARLCEHTIGWWPTRKR